MKENIRELQQQLKDKYGIEISIKFLQQVIDYYATFLADLIELEIDDV